MLPVIIAQFKLTIKDIQCCAVCPYTNFYPSSLQVFKNLKDPTFIGAVFLILETGEAHSPLETTDNFINETHEITKAP